MTAALRVTGAAVIFITFICANMAEYASKSGQEVLS